MFKQLSTAAAALSLSLFSGCAIHPVPEDVTGLDTPDIVKQIRCETRDAARTMILKYLERQATYGIEPTRTIAANLVSQYAVDRNAMVNFNPNLSFPGPSRSNLAALKVLNLIYSGAIAYTFDLTMTENNDLGAGVNLLGAWQATFTTGINGTANRMRVNDRQFTITDKFSFLLRELNTPADNGQQYCDGHVAWGPNYIYPIAGQIGVYNTVYTYFQMSIFDALAAAKADPGASGSPVLTDILTFTTELNLSATPKVVFAQAKAGGNQITDFSLGPSVTRKDIHQVTLGLALEPSGTAVLASLRGYVYSGVGLGGTRVALGRTKTLILNRITAVATSPAEQLAVIAIDQRKSREMQLIPPPSF